MFMSAMGQELSLAFPDVCLTPALVPVPIPYPNLTMGITTLASSASSNLLTMFLPVCLSTPAGSIKMLSIGDNAGVLGGVASGTVMGPQYNIMGSAKVFCQGRPVHRMTGTTLHNLSNVPGVTLSPGQTKVLTLS